MQFDPDNKIVKLCAQGMMLEGEGKNPEAAVLFEQAWNEASDDFEKVIAAHYVARHQNSIADKLQWDLTALQHALSSQDPSIVPMYPSLYLNVAKGYEDLHESGNAKKYYENAMSFADQLPDDGYGRMIKKGIISGLERV